MKRLFCLLLALLLAAPGLTGCGSDGPEARCYRVEENVNSAEVNRWKTLWLLDEERYLLTVDAVSAQDPQLVTMDFYMAGHYRNNGDGTVTLEPGYGYAMVMNGQQKVERPIQPDENGAMGSIYMGLIGQFTTFEIKSDGTWEGVVE